MIPGGGVQEHALGGVVGRRLGSLGITATADLDAFWNLVRVRGGIERDQAIVGRTSPVEHFVVLLEGVACFSSQHEDGRRQIHALRYPGDFFGLDGFLSPRSAERSEVQALTRCSIGTIARDALEQAMQRHPAIGRALWRAALTEVSVFRQRQVVSRLPELQRIAHFLCEQLARLEIDEGVIPLTQIDVADAAGLSVAHANRIFQELRQLDVLSKQPLIEVVNKGHLHKLAAFDARYLDLGESLSRWGLRIDD